MRLNAEIVKALQVPDVRERLLSQSTEPVGNSPQAFAAFIRSEHDKWADVIRRAGIGGTNGFGSLRRRTDQAPVEHR